MTSYLNDRFKIVSVDDELSLPALMEYSSPQGSVMGRKNYILYTKPHSDVIRRHGLQYHFYADDTHLYPSFKPKDAIIQTEALTHIDNCLIEIEAWIHQNTMKLNNDTTKVILFTSKHNSQYTDKVSIQVGNSRITSTTCVRYLGVIFDSTMTTAQRVASICISGYAQVRSIGHIRRYLSNDATKSLVHGLVMSRLDDCNALLRGLPDTTMNKLRRVQNMAARIVTRTARHNHITPVLKKLYWLSVKYRGQYKLLVHMYKALHDQYPVYFLIHNGH